MIEESGADVFEVPTATGMWMPERIRSRWFQEVQGVRLARQDRYSPELTNGLITELTVLPEIEWLCLDGTGVNDEGFATVCTLRKLRRLSFLMCGHLRGTGFGHIANLRSLESLNLTATSVSDDSLIELQSLPNLEALHLRMCPLTDAGVRHLSGLGNLRFLDLSNTSVSDQGLAWLASLTNLTDLDLSGTPVSDTGVMVLGHLIKLEWLGLRDTQVTDRGVSALRRLLPATDVLYESKAGSIGRIRDDIRKARDGELNRLVVASPQFGDAHAPEIQGLRGLVALDLWGSSLTDAGLACLRELDNLEQLDLGSNHIQGPGLSHLGRLKRLRVLYLSDNPITDEHLMPLTLLTELEEIQLGGTLVSDVGLRGLLALPRLRKLSMSSPEGRGPLITEAALRRLQEGSPNVRIVP